MEWKLHKCFYGLNQSSNQTIDLVLKKLEFVKFTTEYGIYAREEGEEWINNALYVDDQLLVWRMESLSNGIEILGVGKTLTGVYSGL